MAVDASAGQIIMVNPGEMHDGVPLNGPRSWQMLYLDPQLVADEFQGEVKVRIFCCARWSMTRRAPAYAATFR